MPRQTELATVPTEALVAELRRRFEELERARKQLFADGLQHVAYREGSGREKVLIRRKRGGTSPYAQKVSSLVQSIRHAKARNESTAAFEKELKKLRAGHRT